MPNIPISFEFVDTEAFLVSADGEGFTTFDYEAPEGFVIVNWSVNFYQYLNLKLQKAAIGDKGNFFQIVVHNSNEYASEFWYQLLLMKKD